VEHRQTGLSARATVLERAVGQTLDDLELLGVFLSDALLEVVADGRDLGRGDRVVARRAPADDERSLSPGSISGLTSDGG